VKVLVDTSVWSLALRRRHPDREAVIVEELAYSTRFRSPIPAHFDHRFHGNPISDSTANRSLIR
jgi:hypothetical protein